MRTAFLILLFALCTFGQLPEIGNVQDLKGKSKIYVDADAANYKRIIKELKKPFAVVARAEDAEFIVSFATTQSGSAGITNLAYEQGEMTVYFYRDKTKVIAWRDSAKTGLKWPSVTLTRRFLKQHEIRSPQ